MVRTRRFSTTTRSLRSRPFAWKRSRPSGWRASSSRASCARARPLPFARSSRASSASPPAHRRDDAPRSSLAPVRSPNLITVLGLLPSVIMTAVAATYAPTLDGTTPPAWVCYATAAAVFFYSTMDNMDGKQARRTGSSSPLGTLFDHGAWLARVWLRSRLSVPRARAHPHPSRTLTPRPPSPSLLPPPQASML